MCKDIYINMFRNMAFIKQHIQNTRYLLKSNVIQSSFKSHTLKSNYKYNENMAKLIFDDGPVLEYIPNSQRKQV